MGCGRSTMTWKRAMSIARYNYPNLGLGRRRRIAGSIVGGLKRSGHAKKKRK